MKLGDEKIAEYSIIRTTRGNEHEMRTLFEDSQGRLLVIRENLTTDPEGVVVGLSTAIEFLPTVEKFTVEGSGGNATAELAGRSVTFKDEDKLPREVKAAGAEMLAGASTEFQAALRELADVGSNYAARLDPIGLTLRELFFDDLTAVGQDLAESEAFVNNWDPQVNEPDDFEKKFKTAYYE